MGEGTLRTRRPPQGALRRLLRAPIWLFRFRLGWLMGGRFIMLTHLGRKSGLPRQTVLEVVRHDKAGNAYYVASGWGAKADWYQNLSKTPRLLLDDGRHRYEAIAEKPPVDVAADILAGYARRSPAAFKNLGRIMLGSEPATDAQGLRRMAELLPMMVLKPRG